MAASPRQQHSPGRLLMQRKSLRILAPGGTAVQPLAVGGPDKPARCPTLPVSRHGFGLPNETLKASLSSGAMVTVSACGLNLRDACLNEHGFLNLADARRIVDIVAQARFRCSCSRGDIELLLEPEVDHLSSPRYR
jgi:hypothetical protein